MLISFRFFFFIRNETDKIRETFRPRAALARSRRGYRLLVRDYLDVTVVEAYSHVTPHVSLIRHEPRIGVLESIHRESICREMSNRETLIAAILGLTSCDRLRRRIT